MHWVSSTCGRPPNRTPVRTASGSERPADSRSIAVKNRCPSGRIRVGRVVLALAILGTLAGGIAASAPASGRAGEQATPVFVTEIPDGYRDWRLVSVAREEGTLNDIRAILGNDKAIAAYREGKLPFPDGAIIARLAWSHDASEENNKAFGRPQSFVAGSPKNGVQFMIRDSKKYAATGGWGYGHFVDGKPAGEALMKTCHACHEAVRSRDFVFTKYSP